jgi:hypothetical protein
MEKIEDIKLGYYDDSCGTVTKVYNRTPNYVIYETNHTGNVATASAGIDIKCMSGLQPLLIQLDSILTSKRERRKFSGRKAYAYMECLSGQPEVGKQVLENLLIAIQKYRKLKTRLIYMLSAISFVVINTILCALINTTWIDSLNKYIVLLFTVASFGSLGGLISVLIKIPKLELDIEGTAFLHVLDGLSRIFLSMVSSIIIFVLIKSDFVFCVINELDNKNLFYAFAIISGFSETFIPGIIKSIEKDKSGERNTNQKPDSEAK